MASNRDAKERCVNLTVAPEIRAERTYTSQFPRKSHRRHGSKGLGIRVLVFVGALQCNAITLCGDGFGVTESGSKFFQQMARKMRGNVDPSITNCVVHTSETNITRWEAPQEMAN